MISSKAKTVLETTMTESKKKWGLGKNALVVVSVIVLALVLGLGLDLGLKKKSNASLANTKPPLNWRRDPQNYILSDTFDTKAPNTTQTYIFNLTEISDDLTVFQRKCSSSMGSFPDATEGDGLVVHVNN